MSPPLPFALAAPLGGRHLVEASAGTGKTWTLCLLYARLIAERGLTTREILVVTFTTAATAELRERIRSELAAAHAALAPDAAPLRRGAATHGLLQQLAAAGIAAATARDRLALALAEYDDAAIQTIHGFCHRALADAPLASGSPVELEFLTDDDPLTPQACADAWRARFAAGDDAPPLAKALLADLARNPLTPQTLAPLVKRRLAKPLADEIWPPAPAPATAAAALDTSELERAFAALARDWPVVGPELATLFAQALADKVLSGTTYRGASLAACFDGWTRWLAQGDPLAPLPDKAHLLDPHVPKRVNKGKTAPGHPALSAALGVLAAAQTVAGAVAPARLHLVRELIDDAARRLVALKRQLAQASYDDILGNLHAALAGPHGDTLAQTLRARYPAALIDEFQDTDPLQFAIVQRVWGKAGGSDGDGSGPDAAPALYLVGDPKQAIYAFRNADVHTYLGARAAVDARHTLADNQRASAGLIDALNVLFGRATAPFALTGLDYPAATVGAKPRARLVDPATPAPLDLWWPTPAARRAAAEAEILTALAQEMTRLLHDPAVRLHPADGAARPLVPADLVVLVRTHKQAKRVRAALAAAGLDAVELSQANVLKSREAVDMRRLLAALANPADGGRVRAALATEVAGLGATAFDPAAASADGPDPLAEARERLAGAAVLWRTHGFARAWRQVLADFAAIPRALAAPGGERRLTNLRHLAELVQPLAERHGAGDALLRAFDDLVAGAGGADGDARQLRLESDRDLIHIVTIHRAKGLEYPVVFCPFLCEPVMPAREGGPGIAYHDGHRAVIDFDPAHADAARAAAKADAFAEHLRLIYVAATRAEHRLVVPVGCWPDGLGDKGIRAAPLHWLAASGTRAADALADWQQDPPAADALAAAWQALAAATPGAVLRPPPSGSLLAAATAHAATDPESRLPRVATRVLGRDWQIGSFTGLMRAASHVAAPVADPPADDGAARDHDREVAALTATAEHGAIDGGPPDPAALAPSPDDILHFPRGAWAGESLHAALEHIDFGDPASWPARVAAALATRPPERVGDSRRWTPAVLGLLADLTRTPLPAVDGTLTLASVRPADCLPEWPFVLPARIDGPAVAARLGAAGLPLPDLAGGRIDGYLKGIVDLVYRHNGRYYLLDWKSNHLGDTPADYAPARLAAAMRAHGYALQALFYALALHRFLNRRVPGYHPDTHFGGIHYLFVRGVRPAWRDADGRPCGIWHHRPDTALLQDLDRACHR